MKSCTCQCSKTRDQDLSGSAKNQKNNTNIPGMGAV